ncbi:hypothetical protein LJ737_04215 [Hymenobacter sp. 15J16-1T3B]|uniref:DUF6527 family protein n=1 Tax=Hymenobacter sp. 15J16-1T3B TaxID=2886941 RepID=UPI001D10D358|nr:DUF6527 family protein [Hymenobacter sp. 15J16-1T3B]MCC3156427.1 hypothetical protein [Hymenobacter sp. 15J16-1T3B]
MSNRITPLPDHPGVYRFTCPGCKCQHIVYTQSANSYGARWSYNGNPERPTFSPSLLIRSGHHIPGHSGRCWCDFNRDNPENPAPASVCCGICHSFVRDGYIEFLNDCTHELAGQTVELPLIP